MSSRFRSHEDYKTDYEFYCKHGAADLIRDEKTGLIKGAYYPNPLYSFYQNNPDPNYAYSDMTKKIDAVLARGPQHPSAANDVEKIFNGTI